MMKAGVNGLEVNDEIEDDGEWGQYIDQKAGLELDAGMAKAARLEEMESMRRIELFEEDDVSECCEATGKAPVTTKWVNWNKGTTDKPDGRCRLVARDFEPKGEKDRAVCVLLCPHSSEIKYCSRRQI